MLTFSTRRQLRHTARQMPDRVVDVGSYPRFGRLRERLRIKGASPPT